MLWVSKALAPAALVAAIVGTTVVVAQPPERKGGDERGRDEKRERGSGPMGERGRPDAAVDAWVKVLVEKIADPHDTVRDSARAALVHVGPQAIPALRKLADSDDNVKAVAARNVIAMIERGPQPGRPMASGRGPGEDRPGPMGPGGDRPAGDRPPMGPMGDRNPLARVLGELNLSEQQEKQVKEIVSAHGKKMQELGDKIRDGKLDPMDARAGFEKLRGELTKDLKDVLNAEQLKKFDAVMQGPPPGARRPGGDGDRGAPPRGGPERERD